MSSSSVGRNRKPKGRELRVKTAIVGRRNQPEERGSGGGEEVIGRRESSF